MNMHSTFHRSAKLLATGSLLLALLAGGTAFAQVVNSKHDLSSGSTTNLTVKSTSTTEVCVFCHTPHGANSAAPLWNRNPSATTFTYYTSASMNSPTATAGSIALQSTMCLSCHDGLTALNSLINSPGSGVGTVPTMTGTAPVRMAAGAANLGADQTNDHPIGVPFCGGAAALPANGCADQDFKLTYLVKNNTSQSLVKFAAGAATDTWYLDIPGVGTALTRDKSDLPLYVNGTYLVPTVQCATCHEPHNANGTASMVSFLRTPNNASVICTTCHSK